jgi:hypothetical protein
MNKIFRIFTMLLGALLWYSCTPDEFSLADEDVTPSDLVEGIAFKIEHDPSNPNIVHLVSLMDTKYTPLWDHPQGRSQEHDVTLKIPFAGTYEVKFGVETRGGVVYGEPVTFTVDDLYAEFINDPLWALLSGGVGEEKTWYLDLDQNGLSRYFTGPLYFYGTADSWKTVTDGETVEGDSWNWKADWPGNKWMMDPANFGSMTFNLKGGANVQVIHNTIPTRGTEAGTYMINVDDHTMRLSDASPLHDPNRDGVVVDWGNIKIMSLTEDYMQLAVLRDPALSGEGACLLVYNFISKDYFDNWTPGEVVEPEPPYNGDPNEDLTTSVSTKKKWTMSLKTPYNWTGLGGNLLNAWTKPEDYQATGWAPYDASLISKISLTLDKTGANAGTYAFTDGSGTPIAGSYTVDDKNNVIFDKAISFAVSGWVSLATGAENKLRIIKTDTDPFGAITALWLGQRSADKDEYMVYCFEPAASGPADPTAAWKSALAGKTFKPDVNWFIDWVNFPPDFTGGWTSATTFGNDFTTNSWVWDANVRAVAESASLKFYLVGSDLKVELTQTKNGAPFTAIGDVVIDPEEKLLNINIPLVDYAGTAASWLNTKNPKHITGSEWDWHFVSHGGSTLASIDTDGLWLGVIANSTAAGDAKDEVLVFHYVKAP